MSEIATKILEARAKMNNGGRHWIRGAFKRKDPSTEEYAFCSVGAVREAVRGRSRELSPSVYRAINEALPKEYRAVGRNGREPGVNACISAIIGFNDHWGRTWGDISRVFRKAARIAEAADNDDGA